MKSCFLSSRNVKTTFLHIHHLSNQLPQFVLMVIRHLNAHLSYFWDFGVNKK